MMMALLAHKVLLALYFVDDLLHEALKHIEF